MKRGNQNFIGSKKISKLVIEAFLLALLISTITLWIYNNPQNDIFPFNQINLEKDREQHFPEIQWDFSSGVTLSTQLTDQINKLMFVN